MGKKKKSKTEIVILSEAKTIYTIYPIDKKIQVLSLDLPAGKYQLQMTADGRCRLVMTGYYV